MDSSKRSASQTFESESTGEGTSNVKRQRVETPADMGEKRVLVNIDVSDKLYAGFFVLNGNVFINLGNPAKETKICLDEDAWDSVRMHAKYLREKTKAEFPVGSATNGSILLKRDQFKGTWMTSVRVYGERFSGELAATKTGVSMVDATWKSFIGKFGELNDVVNRLKNPIEVRRPLGDKSIKVVLYSLPSLEEGTYRYGMASGITFESRLSDAQSAYEESVVLRQQRQRLVNERIASKGESDNKNMVRIMRACISVHCIKLLAEGDGAEVENSEAVEKFVKESVSVSDVMVRYFNVGRHLGHFVHSPRHVFDLCMSDDVCEIVQMVLKGATKAEDRCYMQAASLAE